jgi:hypothetical protein
MTTQTRKISIGEIALNLGSLVSYAFLGAVAVYNVHLYQQIFTNLLPLPWAPLQWIFGLFGWALIQIAELLPILIRSEIAFMALIAIAIGAFPKIAHDNRHSAAVARIRDRINSYPDWWLYMANAIGSVVFVIDLFLVGLHFEPLRWNWFIPSIDFGALIQVIVTVLMFQLTFTFALWVSGGRWFVRNAQQNN